MSKAWKQSESSRVLGNFSLVSDQSLTYPPSGCQAATAAPGALGWPQSHAFTVWITEDEPCWDQGRLESDELVWPGHSQHACAIVWNEGSRRCAWYSAPRPFWNQEAGLCAVFTAAAVLGGAQWGCRTGDDQQEEASSRRWTLWTSELQEFQTAAELTWAQRTEGNLMRTLYENGTLSNALCTCIPFIFLVP